jgi:hypothetical protein
MDVSPVRGTGDDEEGRRFFCTVREQWSSMFRRTNWTDFTFVWLEVENAPYSGRCELYVGLLGVLVTLTYVYDDRFNREMERRLDEMLK